MKCHRGPRAGDANVLYAMQSEEKGSGELKVRDDVVGPGGRSSLVNGLNQCAVA